MARRIPGKEDFGLTGRYFEQELARLGAEVVLGARVEPMSWRRSTRWSSRPAWCRGSVPLPGAELPHVL